MKSLSIRAAIAAAVLMGAGMSHATQITFDDGLDTSQQPFAPLLTHGVPLYQGGFLIGPASTVEGASDMDLVGSLVNGAELAATCAAVVCPTNNGSTFFASLDDSVLYLAEASDAGVPFMLGGFKASFLGNGIDAVPATGAAGVLRVLGVLADGSGTSIEDFELAPATLEGALSFSSYASAFASTPLVAAIFFAFRCDPLGQCTDAFTDNKAQFAIDDIEVSAVPEPAGWAMAALGLVALCLARRRSGV